MLSTSASQQPNAAPAPWSSKLSAYLSAHESDGTEVPVAPPTPHEDLGFSTRSPGSIREQMERGYFGGCSSSCGATFLGSSSSSCGATFLGSSSASVSSGGQKRYINNRAKNVRGATTSKISSSAAPVSSSFARSTITSKSKNCANDTAAPSSNLERKGDVEEQEKNFYVATLAEKFTREEEETRAFLARFRRHRTTTASTSPLNTTSTLDGSTAVDGTGENGFGEQSQTSMRVNIAGSITGSSPVTRTSASVSGSISCPPWQVQESAGSRQRKRPTKMKKETIVKGAEVSTLQEENEDHSHLSVSLLQPISQGNGPKILLPQEDTIDEEDSSSATTLLELASSPSQAASLKESLMEEYRAGLNSLAVRAPLRVAIVDNDEISQAHLDQAAQQEEEEAEEEAETSEDEDEASGTCALEVYPPKERANNIAATTATSRHHHGVNSTTANSTTASSLHVVPPSIMNGAQSSSTMPYPLAPQLNVLEQQTKPKLHARQAPGGGKTRPTKASSSCTRSSGSPLEYPSTSIGTTTSSSVVDHSSSMTSCAGIPKLSEPAGCSMPVGALAKTSTRGASDGGSLGMTPAGGSRSSMQLCASRNYTPLVGINDSILNGSGRLTTGDRSTLEMEFEAMKNSTGNYMAGFSSSTAITTTSRCLASAAVPGPPSLASSSSFTASSPTKTERVIYARESTEPCHSLSLFGGPRTIPHVLPGLTASSISSSSSSTNTAAVTSLPVAASSSSSTSTQGMILKTPLPVVQVHPDPGESAAAALYRRNQELLRKTLREMDDEDSPVKVDEDGPVVDPALTNDVTMTDAGGPVRGAPKEPELVPLSKLQGMSIGGTSTMIELVENDKAANEDNMQETHSIHQASLEADADHDMQEALDVKSVTFNMKASQCQKTLAEITRYCETLQVKKATLRCEEDFGQSLVACLELSAALRRS